METAADMPSVGEAQASEMFAAILDKPAGEDAKPAAPAKDQPAEPGAPEAPADPEPQGEPNEAEEGADAQPEQIIVKIDGKDVALTPEQIADAYKNGLKEKDYRQKTMALSDERRASQAAAAQAEAARTQYAMQLSQNAQQLQALVNVQNQTDWDALLDSDPVEFLKQRNLANKRQTALNEHNHQLAALHAQHQAHQQQQRSEFMAGQREEMLAKIPAWKNEATAKTEMTQLADYLQKELGYDPRAINDITDHRPVVMARKAMLYDQMVTKAQAAQKKVSNLPARVERPGVTELKPVDGRSAVYQRLRKSGNDDDAAALFSTLIK